MDAEPILSSQLPLCFPEALMEIRRGSMQMEENDFVVIDVIAKPSNLRKIAQDLRMSTIWFDMTNGQVFASHPNDGLFLPQIHQLATVCCVCV